MKISLENITRGADFPFCFSFSKVAHEIILIVFNLEIGFSLGKKVDLFHAYFMSIGQETCFQAFYMGCGSNHLMFFNFFLVSGFGFEFRFDPLKLMQILRGKRLMFVGDSVQRGQFESLVCMVQSIIPQGKKSLQRVPPRKIFKVEVNILLPVT